MLFFVVFLFFPHLPDWLLLLPMASHPLLPEDAPGFPRFPAVSWNPHKNGLAAGKLQPGCGKLHVGIWIIDLGHDPDHLTVRHAGDTGREKAVGLDGGNQQAYHIRFICI